MENFPISPTIGASNTELSQYILNAEEVIIEITRELEGYKKITKANGALSYEQIPEAKRGAIYPEHCILWVQSKLRQILNKNTYLSNITKEDDLFATQWAIQKMFITELLTHWYDFELDEKKFLYLAELYMNFLDFATRRPFGAGDRGFLSRTTTEVTQRSHQTIAEESEKKGLFGIFSR